MGTKCAPTYASLYMGWFERKYILPRIQQYVSMYVRYIDDISFIWKAFTRYFNPVLIIIWVVIIWFVIPVICWVIRVTVTLDAWSIIPF